MRKSIGRCVYVSCLLLVLLLSGCRSSTIDLGSVGGLRDSHYALNGDAVVYLEGEQLNLLKQGKATEVAKFSWRKGEKPRWAYFRMLVTSDGNFEYYLQGKPTSVPVLQCFSSSPVDLVQMHLSTKTTRSITRYSGEPTDAVVDKQNKRIASVKRDRKFGRTLEVVDIVSGKTKIWGHQKTGLMKLIDWSDSGDRLRYVICDGKKASLMSAWDNGKRRTTIMSNLPRSVAFIGLCIDDSRNSIIYSDKNGNVIDHNRNTNNENIIARLRIKHEGQIFLSPTHKYIAVNYLESDQWIRGVLFINLSSGKTHELRADGKKNDVVFQDWHPTEDKAIVAYRQFKNNWKSVSDPLPDGYRIKEVNIGKIIP